MEQDKKEFKLGKLEIGIIVGIVLAIIGAGVYSWRSGLQKEQSINSYEACVAAGNPVMESYPERCAANGQTFTNQAQEPITPLTE